MISVRQTARRFGLQGHIAVSAWAEQLSEARPCSVRRLAASVANYRFDTGPMSKDGLSGQAGLSLQSDGHWQFQGTLSELPALDDYACVIASRLVLNAGSSPASGARQVLVVAHEGSREESWHETGFEPLIREHWSELREAGFVATLTATTNGWDIVKVVGGIVGIGIGAAFFGKAQSDHHDTAPPLDGESSP